MPCLKAACRNVRRQNVAKINHDSRTLPPVFGGRRYFTICFDVCLKVLFGKRPQVPQRTADMSELLHQPFFLKDLDQPFFLKESPSIVGDAPPIDVGHLTRMTLGERSVEFQVLKLFDRQAETLLGRMREVGPKGVASLAHTLTGSARGIGAWRVADAAEALERAVVETRELAPALETLDWAVVEARLAICAMLRIAALVAEAGN
jgi:hypothetical protein